MNQIPNITSNAAIMLLKDKLERTEASVRYMTADIEKALADVINMCADKVRIEVHVESLKDAIAKCQKQ